MWVQTLVLFATAFAATSASPSGASTVADRLYIFNNNSYCGGDKWTCVNKPLGVSLTSTHCSLVHVSLDQREQRMPRAAIACVDCYAHLR